MGYSNLKLRSPPPNYLEHRGYTNFLCNTALRFPCNLLPLDGCKQNDVALQGEYRLSKAFRTTDGEEVKNPTVGDHRSRR